MTANHLTRRVGDLVVLRENAEAPSDEEWDETLRTLTLPPEELARIRVLVLTDGGGPTVAQRRRLNQTTGGFALIAAVCSESVRVRFIVSSIALFMAKLQCFRATELDAAFDHLGLAPAQRHLARQNLHEMTALLASPSSQGESASL